jgi:hypothetical protein
LTCSQKVQCSHLKCGADGRIPVFFLRRDKCVRHVIILQTNCDCNDLPLQRIKFATISQRWLTPPLTPYLRVHCRANNDMIGCIWVSSGPAMMFSSSACLRLKKKDETTRAWRRYTTRRLPCGTAVICPHRTSGPIYHFGLSFFTPTVLHSTRYIANASRFCTTCFTPSTRKSPVGG